MRKIQKTAIVGGAVATLMAGGVAFAAWTSTGSGFGHATAGESVGLTVTGGSAVDNLFPSKEVSFTVTVANSNPYDVQVRSLTYDEAHSDSSKGSACTPQGNVHVSIVDENGDPTDGVGDVIDAKAGDVDGSKTYTAKVLMDQNASQDCEGAVFSLKFTAEADSNVVTAP